MSKRHLVAAAFLYAVLLSALRWQLARSPMVESVEGHATLAFASFALLLAPLWFFGFGAGTWIRAQIQAPLGRVWLAGLAVIPYLVLAVPTGELRWSTALIMLAIPVALASLLEASRLGVKLAWQDVVVLTVLLGMHLLQILAPAWPYRSLTALPKLLLTDVVLYLYWVVRGLGGTGYSLVPTKTAVKSGLKQWLGFLPFGIGLGTLLGFLHFHRRVPDLATLAESGLVTLLVIALPEELVFRGIIQNLLETRMSRTGALVLASILFGLSHYHRGSRFNWQYVLLAAIAGIFYGRAWRERRELVAALITHTAVDGIWSTWFR